MKTYSLEEMKDRYLGKIGTAERDEYEYKLRMDVLKRMTKNDELTQPDKASQPTGQGSSAC